MRRFVLALLVVSACGPLVGCATVKPERFVPNEPATGTCVRLPDTTAPPARQTPATNDSPSAVHQASHFTQPEYPETSGSFAEPVPVDTLVQCALANNPEIQAARYHARSLGARVPQAVSLPDPQLMTNTFLEQIQTAAGPQQVAMSLSQKFPWFGKRALRSQVAHHEAMAAYAQVAAEELKVVEQVKRAYYDLYFLQSAMVETRRLEPRLEDIVEIAKTKYETHVGKTDLASVLQAQVELSKLKTTLIRLEQAKNETQARLAGLLHLPPETRFKTVSSVDRTKLAHTAQLLVELSEQCQPELDAIRRQITRNRSATALACRNYWPDVTVGLNWYDIGATGLSPVANGQDAYSLGVGVNLPIYRNRLDAAVREAQYRNSSDHQRYAAAQDRVRSEVEALYAQFQQQHQILGVLEAEILPRSSQMLELTIESYRTGTQDFQQLIDTYRTLLDYRIDYHKRTAMREQAIASLERAVGCAVTVGPMEAGDPIRL
jgi:outer membrane protein TolC